jgi:hypothetical protein
LEAKLIELGLGERRDAVVGSPESKTLSGGERKRLNVGVDMIGMSDVYLFDEPTSGLSSKDSEHVMEIIRGMAHNKIILVSIHQPELQNLPDVPQSDPPRQRRAPRLFLARLPTCFAISLKQNISISSGRNWARAHPAEQTRPGIHF